MRAKWLKFWSKRFLDCVDRFLKHWECYRKSDGIKKMFHRAGMWISYFAELFCDKMCSLAS